MAPPPGMVARPEQTAVPIVDAKLDRSDIRSDAASGEVKEGAPLDLVLAVPRRARKAARRWQARTVDIRHCDATGVKSGVEDPGFKTVGQTFCAAIS